MNTQTLTGVSKRSQHQTYKFESKFRKTPTLKQTLARASKHSHEQKNTTMGRGKVSKGLRKINRAIADGRTPDCPHIAIPKTKGARQVKGEIKAEFNYSGGVGLCMATINKDGAVKKQFQSTRGGGQNINTEVFRGKSILLDNGTANTSNLQELFDKRDFHCWVEDKDGEVVFDPEFKEYQAIKQVKNCMEDSPHFYNAFGEDAEKWFWGKLKGTMTDKIQLYKSQNIKWVKEFYQRPKFGHCNLNCSAFLIKNKGKGYRIRVGSMGWLKDPTVWRLKAENKPRHNDAGELCVPAISIWWEYG